MSSKRASTALFPTPDDESRGRCAALEARCFLLSDPRRGDRRTNERPETTPEQPVVNEETVGVLLGRLANRGLTEIDGCGEAADLAGVAHLQPIQRLRRIRDFLGDAEIVIEKAN